MDITTGHLYVELMLDGSRGRVDIAMEQDEARKLCEKLTEMRRVALAAHPAFEERLRFEAFALAADASRDAAPHGLFRIQPKNYDWMMLFAPPGDQRHDALVRFDDAQPSREHVEMVLKAMFRDYA
jgi:hypothetical protein